MVMQILCSLVLQVRSQSYSPALNSLCINTFTPTTTAISTSANTVSINSNFPGACGSLGTAQGLLAFADVGLYYINTERITYTITSTAFTATSVAASLTLGVTSAAGPAPTIASHTFGKITYFAYNPANLPSFQLVTASATVDARTATVGNYQSSSVSVATSRVLNGTYLLSLTPYYIASGFTKLSFLSADRTKFGVRYTLSVVAGVSTPVVGRYTLSVMSGNQASADISAIWFNKAVTPELNFVAASILAGGVGNSLTFTPSATNSNLKLLTAVAPSFISGVNAILINGFQVGDTNGLTGTSTFFSADANFGSLAFASSAFSVPLTLTNSGGVSFVSTNFNLIWLAALGCPGAQKLAPSRTTCAAACPDQSLGSSICGCDASLVQSTCLTRCPQNCQSCTEFEAGTVACSYCSPSSLRYWAATNGGSCVCLTGFFDNGASVNCQVCDVTCLTCNAATDTSCLSCAAIRVLQAGKCSCLLGYSFGSQCLPCDATCFKCSGPSFSNCVACSAGRTLNGVTNSCDCLTYFYSVPGNANCQACLYNCLTCVNAFSCSTCDSANNRVINQQSNCICNSGFFDDTNAAPCVPCGNSPFYCLTCSLSVCLACNNTLFRSLSNGYCGCWPGYFEATATLNGCTSCSVGCLTCTTLATTCTSCKVNSFLSGSTCVCFTGLVSAASVCTLCHFSCITCSTTSPSGCLACDSGANRVATASGSCDCLPAFFEQGLDSCKACDITCSTCVVTADNCLSCSSQRTLSSNSCLCNNGLYPLSVSSSCSPCFRSCLTCPNAFSCNSCDPNTRIFTSSGQCNCQPGYYDSGSTSCIRCHFSCQTCLSSNPNSCLSCSSPTRSLVESQCACLIGNYEVGVAACPACSIWQCNSCTSTTQCTACSIYTVLISGACECPAGQFVMNSICMTCLPTCQTCSGSASSCTSCVVAALRQQPPSCSCLSGYYDTGSTFCVACSSQCLTCVSSSICSSCPKADLSPPSCFCISNYYQDQLAGCTLCNYNCLTCYSKSLCLTCPPTRYYLNYRCLCLTGYMDKGGLTCTLVSCAPNCYKCTDVVCLYCAQNRVLLQNQCVCQVGFVEISGTCTACNPACQTCSGTVNSCVTCVVQLQTLDISRNCKCIIGTYSLGSECIYCPQACITCSTSFCTACYVGYINLNGNCFRICLPQEYFDPEQNLCLPTCLVGFYYDYKALACVRSSNIKLTNSTAFTFSLEALLAVPSNISTRNLVNVTFSKTPVMVGSFQNLFNLYSNGGQVTYVIVSNTDTSYTLELQPATSQAYPTVLAILRNQQAVSSSTNASEFIQNSQAATSVLQLLEPNSLPSFTFSNIAGVLTFVLIALSLPGSYYLSEAYNVCILLILLQDRLPYTASSWYFVHFQPWFPAEFTPLQMILMELLFCMFAQFATSIVAARIMPSSLFAKRVSYYLPAIITYTALAFVTQLLFYGFKEVITPSGISTQPYWWLVALSFSASVFLGYVATTRIRQLFGQFYERSIDNFYPVLRILRLVLLPFLIMLSDVSTRLYLAIIFNFVLLLAGFFRRTELSLVVLEAITNVLIVVENVLVLLLVPSNAAVLGDSVFTVGSTVSAVAFCCILMQAGVVLIMVLKELKQMYDHAGATNFLFKEEINPETLDSKADLKDEDLL